jgi:hypothetical protein
MIFNLVFALLVAIVLVCAIFEICESNRSYVTHRRKLIETSTKTMTRRARIIGWWRCTYIDAPVVNLDDWIAAEWHLTKKGAEKG